MHFTEAAERKSEDEEPVGNGSHLIGIDISLTSVASTLSYPF